MSLPSESSHGDRNAARMTVKLQGSVTDTVNHGNGNCVRIVFDSLSHGFKPAWKDKNKMFRNYFLHVSKKKEDLYRQKIQTTSGNECRPGVASQCESKKTSISPVAALAPAKRAPIRPVCGRAIFLNFF